MVIRSFMIRTITAPMTFLIIIISFLAISCTGIPKQSELSCDGQENIVRIDTERHRLLLCQSGNSVREFSVAIGRGGRDKQKNKDNRTPLGKYDLDFPRPSTDGFYLFIPVGYPTTSQREQGFTGGDIGIHGPPREWKWLGSMTTWKDWTRGCIAVGTDTEIEDIAKWVNEFRVKKVSIQ